MKQNIKNLISNKNVLIILFLFFALAASFQSLLSGTKTYGEGGIEYTRYNNYIIFERSYHHLINHQDLYKHYYEEHGDLFKYTPTFAVFFGFFAIFPHWIGLNLWNLLNALILFYAIYYLPKLTKYQKGLVLLIILIELITSMQNEQSNGLITGLLVLSFGLLENKKYFIASLCIVFSAFIKIFGILGFVLFLFYPKKWKLALYSILWTLILLSVPLLIVNLEQYQGLIKSYSNLILNDYSTSYGFSVMGWLDTWFSFNINKTVILLAGTFILLIPLIRIRMYKELIFRYLMLSSILIWVVIFNHKAESPTYIIAMTGVTIWFIKSKKNILNIFLFIGAYVLTTLSPTDLFPKFLREEYVIPYTLKAFPCILIWLKIIIDLIRLKVNQTHGEIYRV